MKEHVNAVHFSYVSWTYVEIRGFASRCMDFKVEKDIKVLEKFIQVYCDTKHADSHKTEYNSLSLCKECHEILNYSINRRELCALDPKPTCKNCEIHCYKPGQRQRIREIMRYSGMYLIKRGRLDLLLHYLL